MRKLMFIVFGLLVAGAVSVLTAQDAKLVDTGRTLFTDNKCSLCHLAEGKGNKMYPLTGVAAKMSDADIRTWITNPAAMEAKLKQPPKIKMSSKKFTFKPAEVDALVAYVKSLK